MAWFRFDRKSLTAFTAACAAAGVLVGPTAAKDTAALNAPIPGGCFYRRDIVNHTLGGGYIYLELASRGVYRVTTSGSCMRGAVMSDPVVLGPARGRGSVCRPNDLDVAVQKSGSASRCIVQAVTPMTPDEVAALPKKLRP